MQEKRVSKWKRQKWARPNMASLGETRIRSLNGLTKRNGYEQTSDKLVSYPL